ncbi:hypothetical protein [Asticcacaulis taihuensis]|uniref:hypothetical protein n=1 Tax=Asticcacaulis taihuensis TaxID=260084 RepID=UPI003F7C9D7F
MKNNFSKIEQVEAWQKGKPIEWLDALSLRSALRIVPYIGKIDSTSRLYMFRALFTKWYDCVYGENNSKVLEDKREQRGRTAPSSALNCVAAATGNSPKLETVLYFAIRAYEPSLVWREFNSDLHWLEPQIAVSSSVAASSLMRMPLLLDKVKQHDQYFVAVQKFSEQNMLEDENWAFWMDWFESRLNASRLDIPGLNIDVHGPEIMAKPEAFWLRVPSLVNKDIVMITSAGDEGIDIPDQLRSPIETYIENDRVRRRHADPLANFDQSKVSQIKSAHATALEAIADFETIHNCQNHPGFLQAIGRLKEALGETVADLDVVRAGLVAQRIQENAIRANEIFMPETAADVVYLNTVLQININQFTDWSAYVSDALQDPALTDQTKQLELLLSKRITSSPALHDSTANALVELTAIAHEASDADNQNSLVWAGFDRSLTNVMSTASKDAVAKEGRAPGFYQQLKDTAADGLKEGTKELTKKMVVGSGDLLFELGKTTIRWGWILPVLNYLKSHL